jgi:hypothetical protein
VVEVGAECDGQEAVEGGVEVLAFRVDACFEEEDGGCGGGVGEFVREKAACCSGWWWVLVHVTLEAKWYWGVKRTANDDKVVCFTHLESLLCVFTRLNVDMPIQQQHAARILYTASQEPTTNHAPDLRIQYHCASHPSCAKPRLFLKSCAVEAEC